MSLRSPAFGGARTSYACCLPRADYPKDRVVRGNAVCDYSRAALILTVTVHSTLSVQVFARGEDCRRRERKVLINAVQLLWVELHSPSRTTLLAHNYLQSEFVCLHGFFVRVRGRVSSASSVGHST